MESDVLTVPQAAERLGISVGSYYRAARRGEVPVIEIGRRLVVPRVQLDRLLEGGDAMTNTPSEKESGPRPTTGSRA